MIKVIAKQEPIPQFNPITIELTIQTPEELEALAHQLSVSGNVVEDSCLTEQFTSLTPDEIEEAIYDFYHLVLKKRKEYLYLNHAL